MGLGGTAKKLQKVANAAEELYGKMNEVISQLKDLQREVEQTSEQVDRIEYDVAEQRAIVGALADQQGIDVDAVLADADLPEDLVEDEAGTEEDGGDGQSSAADEAVTDGNSS